MYISFFRDISLRTVKVVTFTSHWDYQGRVHLPTQRDCGKHGANGIDTHFVQIIAPEQVRTGHECGIGIKYRTRIQIPFPRQSRRFQGLKIS